MRMLLEALKTRDDGATMAEYALAASLIAAAVVAGAGLFGAAVQGKIAAVAAAVERTPSGAPSPVATP